MTEFAYTADLDQWISNLKAAGAIKTEEMAEQGIHYMGDVMAGLAQSYAPRRTGELRRSIRNIPGPMSTKVVATAPYAAFVEFGTWSHHLYAPKSGTYEIRPKNTKALRFQGGQGPVYATVVRHPGIKPQPFMRRAAEETLEQFTNGMAHLSLVILTKDLP